MLKAVCGCPVILMIVPFAPEPAPRKTTPLAEMVNGALTL